MSRVLMRIQIRWNRALQSAMVLENSTIINLRVIDRAKKKK